MKRSYLTQEKITKIIELYKQGKSTRAVAKEIGCSQKPIVDILRKNNIPRRSAGFFNWDRKYTINEDFFEKIDTPEKSYICGLFWSDGCNHYNIFRETKNAVSSVALHCKDGYLLEEIKKILGSNAPLIKAKNSNCLSMRLHSEKICLDLIKLGCPPNKSLILQHPTEKQIPQYLLSHFYRGVLDGDGWVLDKWNRKYGLSIGICGSPKFMWSIHFHLKYLYGIESNLRKQSNILSLSIENYDDCKKFYEIIYKNDTISMNRKKERIIEFLQRNIEKSLNSNRRTENGIETKRCSNCKIFQSLTNYRSHKRKDKPNIIDATDNECKKCKGQRDSNYYYKNWNKIRSERNKKKRIEIQNRQLCLG